jgi:hypothetical protein
MLLWLLDWPTLQGQMLKGCNVEMLLQLIWRNNAMAVIPF